MATTTKRRAHFVYGGAGPRVPAHAGAKRAAEEEHEPVKVVGASVGAASAAVTAARVDQATVEDWVTNLEMHRLVWRKDGVMGRLRAGGLLTLDGPIAEVGKTLEEHGINRNGGKGVRTFGDLPPLDADYASQLHPDDRSPLNVRVWASPDNGNVWRTNARLAYAHRFLGDTHRKRGEARPGGVFAGMRTLHVPRDVGEGVDRDELDIATVVGWSMAQPPMFAPGRSPVLPGWWLHDGALLEGVPKRSFPAPSSPRAHGGNDLFRLENGDPDRTPVIAFAIAKPNGLSADEQAERDWKEIVEPYGIFPVWLANQGVGVTDYREGYRRAAELIESGYADTKAALTSDRYRAYLALCRRLRTGKAHENAAVPGDCSGHRRPSPPEAGRLLTPWKDHEPNPSLRAGARRRIHAGRRRVALLPAGSRLGELGVAGHAAARLRRHGRDRACNPAQARAQPRSAPHSSAALMPTSLSSSAFPAIACSS